MLKDQDGGKERMEKKKWKLFVLSERVEKYLTIAIHACKLKN